MERTIRFRMSLAAAALAASIPVETLAQSWVELTPASGPAPAARRNASAVYDPVDNRMVIYGGFGTSYLGDIWAFDIDTETWSDLTPSSGPAPAARLTPASVYDPTGHQMIMWSGQSFGSTFLNDVWSFDFDTHTWSQYAPTGGPPNIRYGVGYTWDPVAHDLVTFAGFTNMGRFHDVWRFNDQAVTWTDVSPATGPLERCLHAACYDAVGHRMIMYGGQNNNGPLGDLWALDLNTDTWTDITPATNPAARYFTALVYDAANRRATMFGGQTLLGATSESWVFDLWTGAWTQLSPAGTPPTSRYGAAGIYDGAHDRMIVFGGNDGSVQNDVWALEGLSSTSTGVRGAAGPNVVLHPNHPNPFNPATTIRYEIPSRGHVRLAVYDVRGRHVRTLVDATRDAGAGTAFWDGRDAGGASVATGVYVYRIETPDGSQARKMVLLK